MKTLFSAVLIVCTIACSGAAATPEDKCRNIVETMCNRTMQCDKPEKPDAYMNECKALMYQNVSCSSIRGINEPKYQQCMSGIGATSCDRFIEAGQQGTIPVNECQGVLIR